MKSAARTRVVLPCSTTLIAVMTIMLVMLIALPPMMAAREELQLTAVAGQIVAKFARYGP